MKKGTLHLIAIIVGAFLLIAMLFVNFGKDYIKQNINEYNCSLFVIPFAKTFGLDPEKNFQQCMKKKFSVNTKGSTNILQRLINSITAVIGGIMDAGKAVTKMLKPLTDFIINKGKSVFSKFDNITQVSTFLFARIKDLLSRMLGTYRLLLYTFSATVLSLKSTWNGPVGNILKVLGNAGVDILAFACFTKNTMITMKNSEVKPIYKIKTGDELFIGGKVYAILKAKYNKSTIYNYNGSLVTGSHLVYENKTWKRVSEADKSILVKTPNDIKYVYCLITENNLLYANNILFTDFEEATSLELEREWDSLVLRELNCSSVLYSPTDKELTDNSSNSCLSGNTQIKMKNGKFKKLKNIEIGDELENTTVLGKVSVKPENIYLYTLPDTNESMYINGCSPILEYGIWIRAYQSSFSKKINLAGNLSKEVDNNFKDGDNFEDIKNTENFYHLITANGKITTENYTVTDFVEVSSNTVEFFQNEVQEFLNV